MYDAIDVSRHLVKGFIGRGRPITNLGLQRLMYDAWVEYYRDTGEYLYGDRILAWKFGPMVEDVYYEYRIFAAMPISFTKDPKEPIDRSTADFLDRLVESYPDATNIWRTGRGRDTIVPWKEVYEEGRHDIAIPFGTIIETECQR
ncbi:MAG: DUF4065 domain-containing protein [archaeon]|nr:DUF4065 domain-containing protein [archaeon]